MKLEKIIELVNAHEGYAHMNLEFPNIVPNLSRRFEEQASELDGVDSEWIKQYVDQFDNYSGTIAYKLEDGNFLTFDFCG
jgi:hypothetical protein